MNLNNLFSGTSSLQGFQILRFSSVFIAGICLVKLGLPLKEIGLYETFLFISYAAASFWLTGIINSLLSLHNKDQKNNILFNTFLLLGGFSILFGLIILIFKSYITLTFGIPTTYYYFLIFYFVFNTPTYLIEYTLYLENRPHQLLTYGLINFFIYILIVAVPLVLLNNLLYSIIGLLIFSVLKFLYLLILLKRYSLFETDFTFIKNHLYLSLPLIGAALIGSSAEYIDGFIVSHLFGKSSFAIFRYGAKEFPISLIMANALSAAVIPMVSSNLSQSLTEIKKQSRRLMNLIFPIIITLMIISPWLFKLMFNNSFIESAGIFNVLLFLTISRLVFPQSIVIGLKQNKVILIISIIEILVNIILSISFALRWGIIGVAYGTLVAFFIEKLLLAFYLFRFQGVKPSDYIPIPRLMLFSILLIVAFICGKILFVS